MKGEGLEARFAELLKPAKLCVFDVDGTLTDGSVLVGPGGESLRFSVQDGFGIKELQKAGLTVAWITGRRSPATVARAESLGVTELKLGQLHKTEALREIQTRLGITPRETVALGDDLPDLSLRPLVAFLAAPANARIEVASRADFVTHAAGGAGAVRELAELVLRAQGRWAAIVASYGE